MHKKLTDSVVQKHLNTPGILRDSILTGFDIKIYTSGKASYIIEPTIHGATKRNVIGKYPLLSVEDARVLAKEKIRELSATTTVISYSPATFTTIKTAYDSYITHIRLKLKNTFTAVPLTCHSCGSRNDVKAGQQWARLD